MHPGNPIQQIHALFKKDEKRKNSRVSVIVSFIESSIMDIKENDRHANSFQ